MIFGCVDENKTKRGGHPRFYELTAMEEAIHEAKGHDYAANGNPTGNFERVSKILSLYPGLKHNDRAIVAVVYMLKQLDAYLWIKSNGHTPRVEGIGERLGDVSIYAKLIRIIEEETEPKRMP